MPLVEHELPTLPEHPSSALFFSGARVNRSLVVSVCFVDRCLSFCTFSFSHCVFCCSSIYGFWLPLWYRIFKFFFISWIASLCQWSILYLELPPFVNVTYRILNCLPFFSYCKSAIGRMHSYQQEIMLKESACMDVSKTTNLCICVYLNKD